MTPEAPFTTQPATASAAGSIERVPLPSAVRVLGTLTAATGVAALADVDIRASLLHPVWPGGAGPTGFDAVRPGESVCVVVSDATRKSAADRVLPLLVDAWLARGCRLADMVVLAATGIHRPPTESEWRGILGEAMAEAFAGRRYAHDPDDDANLVAVGDTRRGHPVRINRRAVEARRLVLLGTASYHYHAGFGGGRKSLVPGLASRDTIAWNHSLTLDPVADRIHPRVAPGVLDGNPVHEEMLEGARLRPPDLIVNTVLRPDGAVAGVFCGELDVAHRAACRLVERLYRADPAEAADLVVASAGVAPDWIQSHKALFNAHRAMKPGGRVVLLAPCPEGLGNERFRHWLRLAGTPAMFGELRRAPEINGQTALSTRERGRDCILVTDLSAADRTELGIASEPDLAAALDCAVGELAARGVSQPTCWLMPQAGAVVPFTPP